MRSIFYSILLTFCVHYISVSSEETSCELQKQIDVSLSDGRTIRIHEPRVNFENDVNAQEVNNGALNNVTFTALIEYEPNKPFTTTTVNFITVTKVHASRDIEYPDSNNESQYCSVSLMREKDEREELQEDVENEIRKLIFPCIQSKLCKSFSEESGDTDDKKINYRAFLGIDIESQDTINAISDFIVSKMAISLTNKNARAPVFNGSFIYPVFNTPTNYTVYNGSFYRIAKAVRLSDTQVVESYDKVNAEIIYRLKDLSTNFLFQLSDRTYEGEIDVNVTEVIFTADLSFDFTTCSIDLEEIDFLREGNSNYRYKIVRGLDGIEQTFGAGAIFQIIKDSVYKVIKKMISTKIQNLNAVLNCRVP